MKEDEGSRGFVDKGFTVQGFRAESSFRSLEKQLPAKTQRIACAWENHGQRNTLGPTRLTHKIIIPGCFNSKITSNI